MRLNSVATVFQLLVMGGRLADIRLSEPAQWSRGTHDPNVLPLPLREIDLHILLPTGLWPYTFNLLY